MEDLNVDFILCEEMEFKVKLTIRSFFNFNLIFQWKEALNNKIPTYLNNDSKFLDDEQTSKERFNQQYNFATNESANLFLVPKPTGFIFIFMVNLTILSLAQFLRIWSWENFGIRVFSKFP